MTRAVLLAGGSGTRMGTPKAHLDVRGTPLWRLVADRLADRGLDVVVSVGPDSWDTSPFPLAGDEGRGPLDGIAAGAAGSTVLVWTVDVPDLDDLDALADAATADHVRCLVDAAGRLQPLLGRWPASVVADIGGYLDGGGRSVHGFLDGVGVEPIGPQRDRAHLTTPRDVERWLGSV